MFDYNETQAEIAVTALNKMMRSSFFDICVVDSVAKMLNRPPSLGDLQAAASPALRPLLRDACVPQGQAPGDDCRLLGRPSGVPVQPAAHRHPTDCAGCGSGR